MGARKRSEDLSSDVALGAANDLSLAKALGEDTFDLDAEAGKDTMRPGGKRDAGHFRVGVEDLGAGDAAVRIDSSADVGAAEADLPGSAVLVA